MAFPELCKRLPECKGTISGNIKNYGKSTHYFVGKSTISMAIFNSKRFTFRGVHGINRGLHGMEDVREHLLELTKAKGIHVHAGGGTPKSRHLPMALFGTWKIG